MSANKLDLLEISCNDLEERQFKIREIEKNIYEIRDCYELINLEILLQAETLNSIEDHIINTKNNTSKAVEDLESAKKNTNWFGVFGKIYSITKFFL